MSQVKVLIKMMQKNWISTADAFNAGVSSFHRRLSDFRESYHAQIILDTDGYARRAIKIGNGYYQLIDKEEKITTRWGNATIKRYKLKRVKW